MSWRRRKDIVLAVCTWKILGAWWVQGITIDIMPNARVRVLCDVKDRVDEMTDESVLWGVWSY